MSTISSREKNKLFSLLSFSMFTSWRIVIVCTNIVIAAPSLMSRQNATYSNYRGMNSSKVTVRVAPSVPVTYVSKPYPEPISDKKSVQRSGLMNHMESGDQIFADKGYFIQDIVPKDVFVNIPHLL